MLVLPPHKRWIDASMRLVDLLLAGAGLVWVLVPATASVMAVSPVAMRLLDRSADRLESRDILPEFSLALADLFAAANALPSEDSAEPHPGERMTVEDGLLRRWTEGISGQRRDPSTGSG